MDKEVALGAGIGLIIFLLFLGYGALAFVLLLVTGAIFFFSRSRTGGFRLGRKQRIVSKETVPNTSFEHIGGVQRVKQELKEALDFLVHRDKIATYGIRPIKGILLYGPPGTGKTMMAKAAAHYTDSVFVSTSGSQFVEMYVGVGAQRIRELFQEARTLARKSGKNSAIIFIDEIDAIGGRREGTQHREYDQTLNQLLTEMDGITPDSEIRLLVVAATNRKDMLDPALLRPGRFDRHINVDLPDKKARYHILSLHLKNKPLASDVDLDHIANETFGFSGAQLESVANEAAIYAMREGKKKIEQHHLSQAVDKVLLGEKTDREASKEERKRVAIHELGHAIAAEVLHPNSVSQVALSPRGEALGYVRHHPNEDRHLYTRKYIEEQIVICLAGSAAEQEVYGNRSTGAQNDFKKANHYARILIESGLSDLGIINPDLISKELMQKEAAKILKDLDQQALQLIAKYRSVIEKSLDILLQEEFLSGKQFRQLIRTYQNESITMNQA